MMDRRRTFMTVLGAAGAAAAAGIVVQHVRGAAGGRGTPGGILVGNARIYDEVTRLALYSFFRGVAADVASIAPDRARVLEVGCGPGHLSNRLARQYGFDVTGVDLDPTMIERARAHIYRLRDAGGPRPSFLVGDVTALAFPDASFDLVVSTLSMHHWAAPRAGLAEIGRVLRPGGRALVWDFRPGVWPHAHLPEPVEHTHGYPLRLASATPWRWPGWITLTHRVELVG